MCFICKNIIMSHHSFLLTLHDTAILKGIAICAMLVHHLFYENPEYGAVVWHCALLGKVCVAIFLFLSGFGLTFQFGKMPIHGLNANSGGANYTLPAEKIREVLS